MGKRVTCSHAQDNLLFTAGQLHFNIMSLPKTIGFKVKQTIQLYAQGLLNYYFIYIFFLNIISTENIYRTTQVWTHLLIPGLLFDFYYFLHCRIIVKTSKL